MRQHDTTITSFSAPWNESTVATWMISLAPGEVSDAVLARALAFGAAFGRAFGQGLRPG